MVIKRGRFGEFLACSTLPRVQDDQPDVAGRRLPEAGLRRLPDREALAPRQGVLRLLELLDAPSATSCRGIARCRSRARSAAPSSSCRRSARPASASAASTKAATTPPTRKRTSRPPRRRARRRARADRRVAPAADRHGKLAALARSASLRLLVQQAPGSGRARERRDRLDVPRLREHVERLHAQAAVAGGASIARSRACVSGLHDT